MCFERSSGGSEWMPPPVCSMGWWGGVLWAARFIDVYLLCMDVFLGSNGGTLLQKGFSHIFCILFYLQSKKQNKTKKTLWISVRFFLIDCKCVHSSGWVLQKAAYTFYRKMPFSCVPAGLTSASPICFLRHFVFFPCSSCQTSTCLSCYIFIFSRINIVQFHLYLGLILIIVFHAALQRLS